MRNNEHPTSNIQHRTSNIEHPTSNIQHRTSNIEHPTFNIQWQRRRQGRPKPQSGESRKQKAESRNWPFAIGYLQSASKATQSHINATSKPPQSVLIAN